MNNLSITLKKAFISHLFEILLNIIYNPEEYYICQTISHEINIYINIYLYTFL